MKKFWNWIRDETNPDARILRLEGAIAEESWFDDEVTPAAFKAELASGSGPITVWINSPGGDCVAAAQIYNMLMDYPSDVIVRIDGIAASAASVIAMAGTKVQMSPVSVMMIHNPLTVAMGDSDEMRRAIQLLDEVKESTINAFECLFRKFSAACTGNGPLYNGYRLLAVDGSDLLFTADPSDPDSYYSGENGQKPYGILHLNALFDLRQKVYVDAIVQKSRLANEHRALCDMVDRSSIDKAILLADRNYESYNDLAHLQEKGRKFLIRVKDGNSGIVSALPLPKTEAFDCAFQLSLTRRQTNEIKKRMKEDPSLKYIASSSPFDFLPSHAQKNEPCVIYKNLSFRVVRFLL